MQKSSSSSSSSSSTVSDSSATKTVDVSTDSPEMSKSEMVKMLKMQQQMLSKLVSTAEEKAAPVSSHTRSSEKNKKPKRAK